MQYLRNIGVEADMHPLSALARTANMDRKLSYLCVYLRTRSRYPKSRRSVFCDTIRSFFGNQKRHDLSLSKRCYLHHLDIGPDNILNMSWARWRRADFALWYMNTFENSWIFYEHVRLECTLAYPYVYVKMSVYYHRVYRCCLMYYMLDVRIWPLWRYLWQSIGVPTPFRCKIEIDF